MAFRNVESHFAQVPRTNRPRSSVPMNHTNITTLNSGRLVPFFVQDVLPGDTFSYDMASLVRLTTSVHPTMDNCYLDTYFFFVPSRLLWSNWEFFMGANDQPWKNTNTYSVPYDEVDSSSNYHPHSVYSYLGIPAGSYSNLGSNTVRFSLLPFNAYCKIWNDWFRDENLQSEVPIFVGDGGFPSAYATAYRNIAGCLSIPSDESCLPVAKFHDYFTSALPAPQKGPDVLVPNGSTNVIFGKPAYGGGTIFPVGDLVQDTNANGDFGLMIKDSSNVLQGPLNLTGLEITVNNLRLAIQTQRLFEADARGGTRYIEILKSHFGVDSPDARLQRSEYLGGRRIPINMMEVTQTSETSTTPLGHLAGKSVTADSSSVFTKSFVEHGYLIGVCCIRSDHTYAQGLERMFSRFDRLQYYWPVFAHLGEQPILNKEIQLNSSNPEEVFGYQEAWAEYRYKPNRLSGYFAPQVTGSLASWTYGDYYTGSTAPVLSDTWIRQGVSEIDRTLVVPSSSAPQFLANFYVTGKMVREMPVYSVPGLMDHD